MQILEKITSDKRVICNRNAIRYCKFIVYCSKLESASLLEKHHILPSSLFPEMKNLIEFPQNCIMLSPRTHFIAHWILAKAYGNKMLYAFNYMAQTNANKKYKTTPKIYEFLKTQMSLNNPSFDKETKDKIRNKALKRWETPEFREKMKNVYLNTDVKNKISHKMKEFYKNLENRKRRSVSATEANSRPEVREKMKKSITIAMARPGVKEKIKVSLAKHWSDINKRAEHGKKFEGEKNPFFGKKHTEETRLKISNSNKGKTRSIEAREKMSISRKGRKNSEKSIMKTTAALKLIWQDPAYRLMMSQKISDSKKNMSEEAKCKAKANMSLAQKNSRATCKYCSMTSTRPNISRYHNENCKHKFNDIIICF